MKRYKVPARHITHQNINGRHEELFDSCGIVILCFLAWRHDANPKGRAFMWEYCRYVALSGCSDTAMRLIAMLESIDIERGMDWIENTIEYFPKQKYLIC